VEALSMEHFSAKQNSIIDKIYSKKIGSLMDWEHMVAKKSIFATSTDTGDDEFRFFTAGNPNFLAIVAGGKSGIKTGKGHAMCFVTIEDDHTTRIPMLFGNRIELEVNNVRISLWPWTRHSGKDLNTLANSCNLTLSTFVTNYWGREMNSDGYDDHVAFRQDIIFKFLMTQSLDQKLSEFMENVRYNLMNAAAVGSALPEFIKDKMKIPIKGHFHLYCYNLLKDSLPRISNKAGFSTNKSLGTINDEFDLSSFEMKVHYPCWYLRGVTSTNLTGFLEDMYQNFHLPKGQKGKIQNLTDLLSGICEWQEKYDRRLKAGPVDDIF
jgi:hypothetical protein